jgi:hypothetical protein
LIAAILGEPDPFSERTQRYLTAQTIKTQTEGTAAHVIQAVYRGHRARRSSSAVRTSHDGNPPAILVGNSDNSEDGNQPATSFTFCWISRSTREKA